MALIQCRITAKFLVQNKKQISAKKAENLHLVGQIVPILTHTKQK